jgi:hypothetical protein
VNTNDFLLHNLQKKVFHGKKKSKNRMTEYGQIFKMESLHKFAGITKGSDTRFYQYCWGYPGSEERKVKRLCLFVDSAEMMTTEYENSTEEKILWQFMFDQDGIPEETFTSTRSP